MKVVIDIPDDIYNDIKDGYSCQEYADILFNLISNGVALPKGHGDLVELDWIYNECTGYHTDYAGSYCYKWADIKKAPPVIEADKGGNDGRD